MSTQSLNKVLRQALVAGAGHMMPGAGNALAARFIEAAGHKMMLVSGAAVANNYLGVPDLGLVSVTELADHVAAIRDVVNIPILADGDTGFGNAINARRTVQLLERAGANAIMLEDQTYPKRCGHFEGKAAVDARKDPDLMILARTDARAVEGFEAALDRARAYQEAGADFLFIEAPLTKEELLAIPAAVPGIHLCNMVIGGKTPLLPREELAQAGYAVVCYANAALQASMLAMQQAMQHLAEHGSIKGFEAKLMMFAERQEALDANHFKELEKRYT
jgi:2-methylisocitrate lyase-like PEP mutase family enzyme